MNTHDIQNRPYAKLSELKDGDAINVDGGFTCTGAGNKIVSQDDAGLYFPCADGRHYLDGQSHDGEHCVGIYRAAA